MQPGWNGAEYRRDGLAADDQRHTSRARAADVQRRNLLGAVNLVVAGLFRHLLIGVERLTDASCANRMPAANQSTAGVDGQLATELDHALFNRLPRLSGLGQAKVVDRHILGGGEAVVGLDALDTPRIRQPGPLKGIDNRLAGVGQDIWIVPALGDLGVKLDRRGMMAPAQQTRDTVYGQAVAVGIFFGEGF